MRASDEAGCAACVDRQMRGAACAATRGCAGRRVEAGRLPQGRSGSVPQRARQSQRTGIASFVRHEKQSRTVAAGKVPGEPAAWPLTHALGAAGCVDQHGGLLGELGRRPGKVSSRRAAAGGEARGRSCVMSGGRCECKSVQGRPPPAVGRPTPPSRSPHTTQSRGRRARNTCGPGRWGLTQPCTLGSVTCAD